MKRAIIVPALVFFFLAGVAMASANTFTTSEGYKGWGGSETIDFTQTVTVDGTDYFGWNPLTVESSYAGGQFIFDITMPRALTGGDNFDLVIDHNNNNMDDDGDFLIHYANNAPVNYWVTAWDAKVYNGGWNHQDLLPTGVSASKIDASNYQVTIDPSLIAGDTFKFAWLSPLGDEGYPEGWTGEAVIISNWSSGNYAQAASAAVPVPAAVWLLGSGLLGLIGIRRKTVK